MEQSGRIAAVEPTSQIVESLAWSIRDDREVPCRLEYEVSRHPVLGVEQTVLRSVMTVETAMKENMALARAAGA